MGMKPGEASEILLPIVAPLPGEELEKQQEIWLAKLADRRETWLEALKSVGDVAQATTSALETLRRITERLAKHHQPEEFRERFWAGPLEECGRAFVEECALVLEVCSFASAPASLAPRILACAVRLAEALGSTGPLLVSLDGELSMVKERVEQLQVLYEVLLKRVDVFAGEVPYLERCVAEEKASGDQARADYQEIRHELHGVKQQLAVAERHRAELKNGLRIAKDDCAIAKAALASKRTSGISGLSVTTSTAASVASSFAGPASPGSSPAVGQPSISAQAGVATASVAIQAGEGLHHQPSKLSRHPRHPGEHHHHHDHDRGHSGDHHHREHHHHHDHHQHHGPYQQEIDAPDRELGLQHRASLGAASSASHASILHAVQNVDAGQAPAASLQKCESPPFTQQHRTSASVEEHQVLQAPDPEASAAPQVPQIGRPASSSSTSGRRFIGGTPMVSPRQASSLQLPGSARELPMRNADLLEDEEVGHSPAVRQRAWTYEPPSRRTKSLAVPSLKSIVPQSTTSQGATSQGATSQGGNSSAEERDGVSSWGDEESSISTRSAGSVSTQLLACGSLWALTLSQKDPIVASAKAAFEHLAALVRKAVNLHPQVCAPQGEEPPSDMSATAGLKWVSEGIGNWAEAHLQSVDHTLANSILHAANNLRMLASLILNDATILKGRGS